MKIPKKRNKLLEGKDFGWKIQSKNIIKKKAPGVSFPLTNSNNNNNRFLDLEEEGEENDEEFEEAHATCASTGEVIQGCNIKEKNNFEVENLSEEDMEKILCEHRELHLDQSLGAGIFKHVKLLEEEIDDKKNAIKKLKLSLCSTEAARFITENQVEHEDKESIKKYAALKAKCNQKCDGVTAKVPAYEKRKKI